ncbi:peptidylprolyl isomerase [Pseudoalteromonas luteoviolacea]|uniref:peptidylprolyl isomerase n=1 Tax=Pseudoalteromonas luteoviolacea S4054 TaxID=1129367 RepID=A0A0F6AHS9_9GAMM|nr:peptidylprolyl isomerase [Pseudoalteromonas luteoviolacea]AOT07246.1 peptidylprolyl isomerase [Pseudoalteromonas luteoviolacea]AOT12161.1 peptidylprolyl isomerase [Pseudoalteromonas luteoviolacea]AOT17074.1 peptidylprolyl isomerase [Pseudoalteromonas luteoviolacea]KKE85326.1 peptidyl-prolyl cis-trans isomerase [Pseudoalteromonas luteoviolacea S4054]KZN73674.1 peptidyl-prolyl cis-trans isomerase [Pseudoalteromonas luteoviolacea S4047-1]
MIRLFAFALIIITANFAHAANKEGRFVQKDNLFPKVQINTSLGKIIVELDRSRAPLTVNNFLTYVVNGDYKGSVFHRVERDEVNEKDFVIQGGGYDKDYDGMFERKPIFNESGNGLKNEMYSVAMAYQDSKPHSGTRQFFFNMDDNDHLNPGRDWGFAVFGNVTDGYETLDKIMQVETGYNQKLGYSFIPKTAVIIHSVDILPAEEF